jgi:hypothetical protein
MDPIAVLHCKSEVGQLSDPVPECVRELIRHPHLQVLHLCLLPLHQAIERLPAALACEHFNRLLFLFSVHLVHVTLHVLNLGGQIINFPGKSHCLQRYL